MLGRGIMIKYAVLTETGMTDSCGILSVICLSLLRFYFRRLFALLFSGLRLLAILSVSS